MGGGEEEEERSLSKGVQTRVKNPLLRVCAEWPLSLQQPPLHFGVCVGGGKTCRQLCAPAAPSEGGGGGGGGAGDLKILSGALAPSRGPAGITAAERQRRPGGEAKSVALPRGGSVLPLTCSKAQVSATRRALRSRSVSTAEEVEVEGGEEEEVAAPGPGPGSGCSPGAPHLRLAGGSSIGPADPRPLLSTFPKTHQWRPGPSPVSWSFLFLWAADTAPLRSSHNNELDGCWFPGPPFSLHPLSIGQYARERLVQIGRARLPIKGEQCTPPCCGALKKRE